MEVLDSDLTRQLRRVIGARVYRRLAFIHHRPAIELKHRLVTLVEAARVHPDDTDVGPGRLAPADDFRLCA